MISVVPIYTTVYTNASAPTASSPAGYSKRELGLNPRDAACVVTETSTTSYGQTATYVPAGKTSTYYAYTAFTQETVTSTKTGGRAYAIATDTATTSQAVCGTSTVTGTKTSTVTQDVRCAPSAMTSAYRGFGLSYKDDVPLSGASYDSTYVHQAHASIVCRTFTC